MTGTAGRSGYLPVSEHGLIGDLHTVALVGTNGTIDWYCCPSFDSPSVFGSLLDADRGGCFELAAAVPAKTRQFYHPDTNVLITRFFAGDGWVRSRTSCRSAARLKRSGVGCSGGCCALPYSRAVSTFAPVRCAAAWRSWWRSGPSWASVAASMSTAVATCCCPAAGRCVAAAARRPARPGSVRKAPSPSGGAPWWKKTAQLRPGGVRAAQVVVGLQQRPVLQDLRRRDPASGQPALGQQRPQMPGVGLIGLGVPLTAPQRGGVRRLAQMRGDPGHGQLPGHIPPARASLHRERDVAMAGEPGQPGAHVPPAGRGDLAPLDLPGHGVQVAEGDLLPVDIQPAYDGHRDLLTLPGAPQAPTREWLTNQS